MTTSNPSEYLLVWRLAVAKYDHLREQEVPRAQLSNYSGREKKPPERAVVVPLGAETRRAAQEMFIAWVKAGKPGGRNV